MHVKMMVLCPSLYFARIPVIFSMLSMGQMHVIGGKEGFDRVL